MAVLERVDMFMVERSVEPNLQQIHGAQFDSGATLGGHLTISLGAMVICSVKGPFDYFHTHLPHFSVCERYPLAQLDPGESGHLPPDIRSPRNCRGGPEKEKQLDFLWSFEQFTL